MTYKKFIPETGPIVGLIRLLIILCLFIVPIIFGLLYIPGLGGYESQMGWRLLFVYQDWFGGRFRDVVGFESVKVLIFIPLALTAASLAFINSLFTARMFRQSVFNKFTILSFLVLLSFCLSVLFSEDLHTAIHGSEEKRHGLIFYISLGLFFLTLVYVRSRSFLMNCIKVSCLSFLVVVIFAALQKFGMDPNMHLFESRVMLERVFATLGNANYVAGYALLFFPLFFSSTVKEELGTTPALIIFFLATMLLVWSGSLIGIAIGCLFVFIKLLQKYLIPSLHPLLIYGGLALVFVGLLFLVVPTITKEIFIHMAIVPEGTVREVYLDHLELVTLPEKVRGFLARPFYWSTAVHALSASPLHFGFGYGPDQFITVFDQFRHPFLMHDIFEHTDWAADRTHNTFLDWWVHGGIGAFLILSFVFVRSQFSHRDIVRDTFLLFTLFFFFNIPVIAHYTYLCVIGALWVAQGDQED